MFRLPPYAADSTSPINAFNAALPLWEQEIPAAAWWTHS
jgi:hypothetical protein